MNIGRIWRVGTASAPVSAFNKCGILTWLNHLGDSQDDDDLVGEVGSTRLLVELSLRNISRSHVVSATSPANDKQKNSYRSSSIATCDAIENYGLFPVP